MADSVSLCVFPVTFCLGFFVVFLYNKHPSESGQVQ